MEAPHPVNPDVAPEASRLLSLLRRFFPFYCILAALVTFGYALYDAFQIDGDAVNYMDVADLLRQHQWAGIVNGYWHPLYPALLALGRTVFHASLANELHAYYLVNYGIFLLEMLAIVCFTDALVGLRSALQPADSAPDFLLSKYPLRYLGLALLVIASQRELSLGKVRPDALLQALLLFALAALLTHLATSRLRYAALLGLALGCAYLTKSFAFVFALLCILAFAAFRWLWLKHSLPRVIPAALVAFVCFGVVAGPYVAALSRQHGRLDFGDSGSLNYAWYVSGTEKYHLEPYMTSDFGTAEVHLKHPDRELLHSPQIFSYAVLPWGTYPDWFDPTYFNDQVKPHFNLHGELSRGVRNCVLVLRYLFNHPEALILLAMLLVFGARLTLHGVRFGNSHGNAFWLVPLTLGALIWIIYATVNTEERYVTIAYLTLILTLFATLRVPTPKPGAPSMAASSPWVGWTTSNLAPALILFLALLAAGESLRTVFEDRRNLSGTPGGWYSPNQEHAAAALDSMGLQPGDQVACIGYTACLGDFYWARLARVRILTEIYAPNGLTAYELLAATPNRDQAYATLRAQGAKVLVADFADVPATGTDAALQGWQQLGDSTLYELRLNLPPGTVPVRPPPRPRPKPSI
jgi:hypothetical protein